MSEAEQIVHNQFSIPKITRIDKDELELVTSPMSISGVQQDFLCKNGSFKFGLIKKSAEDIQLIFKFDFFEVPERMLNMYSEKQPPTIKLEQIWVQSDYRHLKIATYYMKRLVEYAKSKGIKMIKMVVNPNADVFKGDNTTKRLSKEELKAFYLKFEDENLKIKFLE